QLGSGADTLLVRDTPRGTTNITFGGGNDNLNVQGVTGVTNANLGAGTNTVIVGSLSPGDGGIISRIRNELTVEGGGTDSLLGDDTGSETGRDGELSSTSITGLGMRSGRVNYRGLTTLTLSLGSGDDTFTVLSTSSANTTINAGSGDDEINIRATTGA